MIRHCAELQRRRSGDRDGRPIPNWERSLSRFVIAAGAVTILLAICTATLLLYTKFRDPSCAGAIIGPGVGTLLAFPVWAIAWSLLRTWRQDDREFRQGLHGWQSSGDENIRREHVGEQ